MRCPQAWAAATVVTISLNRADRMPPDSQRKTLPLLAWPTAPNNYTILPLQGTLGFRTISLRLSSYEGFLPRTQNFTLTVFLATSARCHNRERINESSG